MTLGRQFENTYWEDPETGETHSWTRAPSTGSLIPSGRPLHQIDGADALASPERPLQGLLFHPLTGTGLKGDPMIPSEMRRGVIQRALGLTDVEKYKKNLVRLLGQVGRSNISDKVAESHIRRITNTLDDSGMPTQIIAKKESNPVRTVLDPIPGRAWAESGGTGIRLTSPTGGSTVTEKSIETVNVPSETPVHNPKFWDHLRQATRRSDTHNEISADSAFEIATHWVHPETGHVLTSEEALNFKADEAAEFNKRVGMHSTSETPARFLESQGYVPNLFPGKGSKTAKSYSIGRFGPVETGYSDIGYGNYTYSPFHARFTPGGTEEKVVYRNVRVERPLSESTLVHELGHAMDSTLTPGAITHRGSYILGNVKKGWNLITQKTAKADPLEEGIADASTDRYTRYKDSYEDVLANTEGRARDFELSGYTTGYGGWKNNTHRALYAATRFHAALGDNMSHPQPVPSRRDVLNALPKAERYQITTNNMGVNEYHNTIDSLVLGHMYHHMPHIHGVLKQLGLEKAAKTAHQDYKTRMWLDQPTDHPTLPGMEDFV